MPYQRLRLHWDGFSPPTPVLIPYFHLTATIFLSLLVIQSNATCADCCIHGICSAGYKFGPAQCCGRMRATNEANSSIVFVCCPLPASVCVKRAGRLGCAFHRRQPGYVALFYLIIDPPFYMATFLALISSPFFP